MQSELQPHKPVSQPHEFVRLFSTNEIHSPGREESDFRGQRQSETRLTRAAVKVAGGGMQVGEEERIDSLQQGSKRKWSEGGLFGQSILQSCSCKRHQGEEGSYVVRHLITAAARCLSVGASDRHRRICRRIHRRKRFPPLRRLRLCCRPCGRRIRPARRRDLLPPLMHQRIHVPTCYMRALIALIRYAEERKRLSPKRRCVHSGGARSRTERWRTEEEA